MTKRNISILLFLFIINTIAAQQPTFDDSLKAIINLQRNDTAEVNALVNLAKAQPQFDSALKYAQQGLLVAQKLNYKKGEADCYFVMGLASVDLNQAIKYFLSALSTYKEVHDINGLAVSHLGLLGSYREALDYQNALQYGIAGEQIAEANKVLVPLAYGDHRLAPVLLAEIGQTYLLMNKPDSALLYVKKSIEQNETFNGAPWGFPFYLLATIETRQENYTSAIENFRLSISLSILNGFPNDTLQIYSGMSTLFKKTGRLDSVIFYAQKVSQSVPNQTEPKNMAEALANLAIAYKLNGNKDSALKYMELSQNFKDSFYSREKNKELHNITFNEHLKQQEIIATQIKYKSKVRLFALASGLFVVLLIAGILWRNNLHRKKAYERLQTQKDETDFQKIKVEQAFDELKSAQAQLVQREKMASLGELTAGIAHEIQNPLNFVNNFSEVNTELIDEMKAELAMGNGQLAIEIADNIKDNEQKINHHGKRADAIVKGMLQHSQTGTGEKEPTDINKLADEYLRLAFQGFRAKDKNFTAILNTDFDENIGKINIIPQDIGRVLLNLYNNAFYAASPRPPQGGIKNPSTHDNPAIWVSTKKVGDKIFISVKDNGPGIPQKIVDKIFQPFFTTKPTGQGTGLGLSLSYDIIKAHGGEIKVETKEEEGASFIIELPIT